MSAALVAVVAVVLLGSGVVHLAHRGELRRAIALHAVLPRGLHGPAAWGLPSLEVLLGGALLALLGLGSGRTGAAALLAGVLLAAMTAYVHVAARRSLGSVVPCGCGLGEAPLGLWVTVRAGLLTALAVIGALTLGTPPADRAGSELVVMGAATVALAIGISVLPQARVTLTGVPR